MFSSHGKKGFFSQKVSALSDRVNLCTLTTGTTALIYMTVSQFHRGMLYKWGCVEVGNFSVQSIGVFWGKS